jgi:leucyl/phenylalanyl-tRNA--protein transferase
MPVRRLGRALVFPPVEDAEDGLLAVGGDLSPERLLLAYRSGIFPWYDERMPILRVLTRGTYEVRYDTAFERVIRACQKTPRPGQDGTWITEAMVEAYVALHDLGFAHSIEAWLEGELAGGLYGVSIGRMFFGESMFSWQPSASKVALVRLAERVARWEFPLIDAQVATEHTLSMGAEEWPREVFMEALGDVIAFPTRRGSWSVEEPELLD